MWTKSQMHRVILDQSLKAAALVLAGLAGMWGCDECKTAADCALGEICADGQCRTRSQAPLDTGSTDSDRSTLIDDDTAPRTDTDGTHEPSTSGPETDDTVTGTSPPDGTDTVEAQPLGSACERDGDCQSGHCENGFCCTEGDCCAASTDCPERVCAQANCIGYACTYLNLPCGSADQAGDELCHGDKRCDDSGACVAYAPCDGASGYRGTGEVVCEAEEIKERCADSCETNAHCADTHYCDAGGACLAKLPNGGQGCTRDSHCQSNNCNLQNGICCASGFLCCDSHDDCHGTACDLANFYCQVSCSVGGVDDDARCDALTNAHCDGGYCVPDIADGRSGCNEHSDCASGYCDAGTGICCGGGSCCSDDHDCDGHTCGPDFSCSKTCDEQDDTGCVESHHCEAGVCAPDFPDGVAGCTKDDDCQSGHCTPQTGVCCSSGTCCRFADDCQAETPCSFAQCSPVTHSCASTPLPDGASCDDDVYCNGPETCEDGACVSGQAPCLSGDTICADISCNETENRCDRTPKNNLKPCSDPLFCLGGKTRQCAGGLCLDPPRIDDTVYPCEAPTGNPCTESVCIEDEQRCEEMSKRDGYTCNDGTPCTEGDTCFRGTCVGRNPCEDGNPCTEDACVEEGLSYTCGGHTELADGASCARVGFMCLGSDATCLSGKCVPGDDLPCDDGDLCTRHSCVEDIAAPCVERTEPTLVFLTCGQTVGIPASAFQTREIESYGASCPGTFSGHEARLKLELQKSAQVTLTLGGAAGPETHILALTDPCDPATCFAAGTGSITKTLVAGLPRFVVENSDLSVPDDLTVTASCQ